MDNEEDLAVRQALWLQPTVMAQKVQRNDQVP